MLESRYQAQLIKRLKQRFPGCLVLKNDTDYLQGVFDLTVLWGPCWGALEVKRDLSAPTQPNQVYYIEWAASNAFGAFICPENEREVLDGMEHAFQSARAAFGS